MAKETKAEAAARHELEAEASYQAFVRQYPARFACVLFKYMELEHAGFRVKRMDHETYSFYRVDHRWSERELKVTPPANRNWEVTTLLGDVESELADYAAEQAEADRKFAVKTAALAKLNKEERELLGL
jgi:hypothetical protein